MWEQKHNLKALITRYNQLNTMLKVLVLLSVTSFKLPFNAVTKKWIPESHYFSLWLPHLNPIKKREILLLLIIEIPTSLILLLFLAHIPSITTKNRQIPHPLKLLWTLRIVGDKRSLPPTLGQQHSRFYPILSTFLECSCYTD